MAELQRHLASSREAFQLVSLMLVAKHEVHAECKRILAGFQQREVQQAVAEARMRAQLARARADLTLVCEQLATSRERGETRAEEARMAVERLLEDAIDGRWEDCRRFKERQARSALNLSPGLGLNLSPRLSPLSRRRCRSRSHGKSSTTWQSATRRPSVSLPRPRQKTLRCWCAPTRRYPPAISPLPPLALLTFLSSPLHPYYQPSSRALSPSPPSLLLRVQSSPPLHLTYVLSPPIALVP